MSEGLRYIPACDSEATCEPASTACIGSSQRLATSATLEGLESHGPAAQDSFVFTVVFCTLSFVNLIRVAYVVRRPCSDFTDMLRRHINCRIIIIIIIIIISHNGACRCVQDSLERCQCGSWKTGQHGVATVQTRHAVTSLAVTSRPSCRRTAGSWSLSRRLGLGTVSRRANVSSREKLSTS